MKSCILHSFNFNTPAFMNIQEIIFQTWDAFSTSQTTTMQRNVPKLSFTKWFTNIKWTSESMITQWTLISWMWMADFCSKFVLDLSISFFSFPSGFSSTLPSCNHSTFSSLLISFPQLLLSFSLSAIPFTLLFPPCFCYELLLEQKVQ